MLYIGKASKFYTLWDVTSEVKYDRFGSYTVTHNVYLKNISFDFEKAKSIYPDAPFSEMLHGHTSWDSVSRPKYANDEFNGGKYAGTKINECEDYGYLFWAVKNSAWIVNGNYDLVAAILEPQGYKRMGEDLFISPEEVKMIEERFESADRVAEEIEKNGYIDVMFDHNIDDFGHYLSRTEEGLEIVFPEFEEYSYQGFPYYLPLLNGKAKRIKNKNVRIYPETFEVVKLTGGWGATCMVNVKNFEILK